MKEFSKQLHRRRGQDHIREATDVWESCPGFSYYPKERTEGKVTHFALGKAVKLHDRGRMEALQMSASICIGGRGFSKGKLHYLFKGLIIPLLDSACIEVNFISGKVCIYSSTGG